MTPLIINIGFGTVCLLGLLLIITPKTHAAEKDELASAQNLLIQVQSAIERAQQAANQDRAEPNERYFFDYSRATSDLDTIHAGIDRYLQPSRAQPRQSGGINGIYRSENKPE